MSIVVIGGGPRPNAQVKTVSGVVAIVDGDEILASGFSDEADAGRYLDSCRSIPHEEIHHDGTNEA